jgi:hypothetical protein
MKRPPDASGHFTRHAASTKTHPRRIFEIDLRHRGPITLCCPARVRTRPHFSARQTRASRPQLHTRRSSRLSYTTLRVTCVSSHRRIDDSLRFCAYSPISIDQGEIMAGPRRSAIDPRRRRHAGTLLVRRSPNQVSPSPHARQVASSLRLHVCLL